jgi:hypothetical protein
MQLNKATRLRHRPGADAGEVLQTRAGRGLIIASWLIHRAAARDPHASSKTRVETISAALGRVYAGDRLPPMQPRRNAIPYRKVLRRIESSDSVHDALLQMDSAELPMPSPDTEPPKSEPD